MADSSNGRVSQKMPDSAESARGIGHFKIVTFSRLSGIYKEQIFQEILHHKWQEFDAGLKKPSYNGL